MGIFEGMEELMIIDTSISVIMKGNSYLYLQSEILE